MRATSAAPQVSSVADQGEGVAILHEIGEMLDKGNRMFSYFELLLLAPSRKAGQRERLCSHFSICIDRETRSCALSELHAGHSYLL